MSIIKFYSEKDEYGFLSNFFPSSITINEMTFPTVEHYFQSKKFNYEGCSEDSVKHSEIIRASKSPYVAKLLGGNPDEVLSQPEKYKWMEDYYAILKEVKEKDIKIDPEWETINKFGLKKKDIVMFIGLCEKFRDPELNKLLLSTGNTMLVEHTDEDSYWGDGGDGSGTNILGILLMSIRK